MKVTLGQLITLVSAVGGIVPILTELVQKGTEAFQTCAAAAAPVWALALVAFSALSGLFSKSVIDSAKGK